MISIASELLQLQQHGLRSVFFLLRGKMNLWGQIRKTEIDAYNYISSATDIETQVQIKRIRSEITRPTLLESRSIDGEIKNALWIAIYEKCKDV